MSLQHKTTEPISILKHTLVIIIIIFLFLVIKRTNPFFFLQSSPTTQQSTLSTRIVLSDEEDEDGLNKYTSDGDIDDEDPNVEPMSAEALELLQTEKVLKAGYLLKKGEKRRVS